MKSWRTALATAGLGVALLPAVTPFALAASFRVDVPEVTASTGLAADGVHDVYWTVNRTGRSASAVSSTGALKGTLGFGFTPVDVEAMAVYSGRLYIADIGDPQSARQQITVYRISDLTYGRTPMYRSWSLTYPDGAHDASAFFVTSKGRMYVVTKDSPGAIYAAPAAPSFGSVNQLTKVASAPAYVTDAAALADGRHVALRTYTSVQVVDDTTFTPTAAAELPVQYNGESLTTALDGSALLIGSLGPQPEVQSIPIPAQLASVTPAPSSFASPTPSASASAGATTTSTSNNSKRTGTVIALVAAGVLALAAAAVVAAKR